MGKSGHRCSASEDLSPMKSLPRYTRTVIANRLRNDPASLPGLRPIYRDNRTGLRHVAVGMGGAAGSLCRHLNQCGVGAISDHLGDSSRKVRNLAVGGRGHAWSGCQLEQCKPVALVPERTDSEGPGGPGTSGLVEDELDDAQPTVDLDLMLGDQPREGQAVVPFERRLRLSEIHVLRDVQKDCAGDDQTEDGGAREESND